MITRIRELLDTRQLTPTQFADLIGVGRPVISHILSERNKPSLEVVQKIIGAFPDIALPWLLAGTGPMLAADAAAPPAISPATPPIMPEMAPVLPPPAPIPPAFVAPTPAPTSPGRATAPSQPNPLPQPPKFRPSAALSPLAAPRPVPAPSSVLNVATTEPELLAATSPLAAPTPAPGPVLAAPPQAPLPPPAAVAAPATSVGPVSATGPTTPGAEDPAAGPDTTVSGTSAAAALSFLGEPGKAIRRIVIFYRDGSFSDYLPDGR